jgi:hypothetical protein
MASSQDKAIALKDAYVKGIVDATSEAPSMPEQDMGESASLLMDLQNKEIIYANDGDRNTYIRGRGGDIKKLNKTMNELVEENFTDTGSSAHPHGGAARGYRGSMGMGPGREELFQQIYNDPKTSY